MDNRQIGQYYDEEYYGRRHGSSWIRLSFGQYDYYGTPLQFLGCKKGEKLLDVACGEGQLLSRAESLGLDTRGIDISQVATERARKQCRGTVVCSDVNNGLPFESRFFDYVTCLGSLEHFEKQTYVLSEICRVTKNSGRIYFLVPNDDYILHKLGYETDDQPVINRYSLRRYTGLLSANGLIIERTLKNNSHISNLSESSSLLKLILKLMISPFVGFIPLRYSYNFIFICLPKK